MSIINTCGVVQAILERCWQQSPQSRPEIVWCRDTLSTQAPFLLESSTKAPGDIVYKTNFAGTGNPVLVSPESPQTPDFWRDLRLSRIARIVTDRISKNSNEHVVWDPASGGLEVIFAPLLPAYYFLTPLSLSFDLDWRLWNSGQTNWPISMAWQHIQTRGVLQGSVQSLQFFCGHGRHNQYFIPQRQADSVGNSSGGRWAPYSIEF